MDRKCANPFNNAGPVCRDWINILPGKWDSQEAKTDKRRITTAYTEIKAQTAFSSLLWLVFVIKGLPATHTHSQFTASHVKMLALKQEDYNRGINLLLLIATGGKNVWIEIQLSSCWLQNKGKKYSLCSAGRKTRSSSRAGGAAAVRWVASAA